MGISKCRLGLCVCVCVLDAFTTADFLYHFFNIPVFYPTVGSDNMANPLTHRIYVSSRMSLTSASDDGVSLADERRLAVDIGDLPILQQLRSQGIGGILGLDVLRRVDMVRLRCRGSQANLEIYEKGFD
jgi:hypothetical protein